MYFNPCGGQPVNGFEFRRCFPACIKTRTLCLASGAFQVAGYLLDGRTINIERNDYRSFLRTQFGQRIIDLEGNIVVLSQKNIETFLDSVIQRAQEMFDAINLCAERTIQLDDEYIENCSPEQKEVLFEIEGLSEQAGKFRGTKEEAEELVGKIRANLERAIELGLDEVGLVLRQSLAYGLGKQVLEKRDIPVGVIPTETGVFQPV
jgi:hypothetical protein